MYNTRWHIYDRTARSTVCWSCTQWGAEWGHWCGSVMFTCIGSQIRLRHNKQWCSHGNVCEMWVCIPRPPMCKTDENILRPPCMHLSPGVLMPTVWIKICRKCDQNFLIFNRFLLSPALGIGQHYSSLQPGGIIPQYTQYYSWLTVLIIFSSRLTWYKQNSIYRVGCGT